MKNFLVRKCLFALVATTMLLSSCEEIVETPDLTSKNLKGMFVVCEGGFGKANGDITFYDSEKSLKSLFNTANNMELGDVAMSFEIVDTLGFIAVNNSQKVTVVNMKNFKVLKTIEGFSYPRSIVRANETTVYVSNGNGYSGNCIYSIDLKTLTKKDSLSVATGPEKLLKVGSKVYAAIAGGWNNDGKSVVEIDPTTFKVVNTFEVAPVPVDITVDINNNLWVYSKGVASYDANWNVSYSGMGISKINISTKTVETFPLTKMSAGGINNIATSKDGSIVYYLNDGLYAMPVSATALPNLKLVDQTFYGLAVDPKTGAIICLDDVNSKAVAYDAKGAELFNFETATFPNSVVFSY